MRFLRPTFAAALALVPGLLAACSSTPDGPVAPTCPTGVTCTAFASSDSEQKIQDAFATAKDGQLLLFGEGTFKMSNTLIIAANKVTVRGQGMGKTILDFKGQKAGA
ncbi:hypothetical protein BH09MYX1_BH09MYX1_53010 [soil metagenome]